jgi:hypothetical protein
VTYPLRQGGLKIRSKCGNLRRVGYIFGQETGFDFVRVREITLQRIATGNDSKLGQSNNFLRYRRCVPFVPIDKSKKMVRIAAVIAEPFECGNDRLFVTDSFDLDFCREGIWLCEFIEPCRIDCLIVLTFNKKNSFP